MLNEDKKKKKNFILFKNLNKKTHKTNLMAEN